MNHQGDHDRRALSALSEEELIDRARHGDRAAAEALLTRHAALLVRVARAVARAQGLSPNDWEDAEQEAGRAFHEAVAVYRRTADQQAPDGFARLLRRLIGWRVRDLARRQWHHERHYDRLVRLGCRDRGTKAGHDPVVVEPQAVNHDPVFLAEVEERVCRVRHLLRGLPPRARRLLRLLAAGMSLHAVARHWRCPYGSVKRLWQPLRAELQSRLANLVD
jgi:RNA polymerase sigma factor (sigma-70 family)